jgi:chemosensory pili system protein ChpA (sensor histidine kinase/response regulator)
LELLQSDGTVPDTAAMVSRIEAALRGEFDAADSVLRDSMDLASETLSQLGAVSELSLEPSAASGASADLSSEGAPGFWEVSQLADEEQAESAQEAHAEADSQLSTDSQLLTDSQLMTDSELLGESQLVESQLVEAAAVTPAADAAAAPAEDGQVIPFPARERPAAPASSEVPLRRPPPEEDEEEARPTQERVRVRADLLNQMVNNAGEVSIYRARLEQQNSALGFNLDELEQTINRLREQLRQLEMETEAQILSRHEGEHFADFDPLELDRYSNIQQLSRALSETVSDLASIGSTLDDLSRDTETLLLQHARVSNELQDGLLRTRMVPFSSRVSRLQRVVRQTAQSMGKRAELMAQGAQGEMDRSILERIMAPLEHLLRNSVAHGIEDPATRSAAGKPEVGQIQLELGRDGSDVLVTVSDDGAGLNRAAIRRKAIARGLLDAEAEVEDDVLDQYILEPGFSTADQVTQIAGRGVGMDVVQSEIKQLGGTLQLDSQPGKGVRFTIRLPFTLAITDGLLVQQGEDVYAVPHGSVDGVLRVSRQDLEECYAGRRDAIHYAGKAYQVRYLGSMLSGAAPVMDESQKWYPLLLVRSGDHRVAVHVDALLGNRQIVVKSVGVQLATVRWFSGATILADGRVAMILDMSSLVRAAMAQQASPVIESVAEQAPRGVTVMVVDDSITVRKVTTRLLERHNMQVITAKDGVDAVAALQEHQPDVMLLDIEMPRMDGFELARHMQNTEELHNIPIIMITSRTGDKHRERALSLGVKRYLGKPYQEADLLDNIYTVLAEHAS